MGASWITCGTPTIPGIVNPITAACDRSYRPDELHILSNPGVDAAVLEAVDHCQAVVGAYGGDLTITVHEIDEETNFAAIVDYYRDTITGADGPVAVDMTPGRKFMSAIAFQAGIQYDADHVFYFHRKTGAYEGKFYPEIPRSATDLLDFTEVL